MTAHRILEHKCFEELVDQTNSDATFELAQGFDLRNGEFHPQWVINLWHYTPALRISINRGYLVPNFCPICGEDFRTEEEKAQNAKPDAVAVSNGSAIE